MDARKALAAVVLVIAASWMAPARAQNPTESDAEPSSTEETETEASGDDEGESTATADSGEESESNDSETAEDATDREDEEETASSDDDTDTPTAESDAASSTENSGSKENTNAEKQTESDEGSSQDPEKAGRDAADATRKSAERAATGTTEGPDRNEEPARNETRDKPDAPTSGGGAGMIPPSKPEPTFVIEQNEENSAGWKIGIGGYLRMGFTHIQDDPNVDYVGRHDGFVAADARLSIEGRLDNGVGFMFEFDGAVNEPQGPNSPVIDTELRLKDTFVFYKPFRHLRISLGQFKPPYDIEELTSNSELLFITESVGSRGVRNVEGYNVDGLSLTREVGLRVDGEPLYPMAEDDERKGIGFDGAVAITNGQTANRNLNDNDKFALYARAEILWGDLLQLGGAYYINDETIGDRPDRVDRTMRGWTGDLTVDVQGVTAIASVMSRTEVPFTNTDTNQGETTALAYQGQIAYEEPFFGVQPAYRFAYYNPVSNYTGPTDGSTPIEHTRTYHTIGLNYNAKSYPVRVMLNYTFTNEGNPRSLTNNRLDALVQVTW